MFKRKGLHQHKKIDWVDCIVMHTKRSMVVYIVRRSTLLLIVIRIIWFSHYEKGEGPRSKALWLVVVQLVMVCGLLR